VDIKVGNSNLSGIVLEQTGYEMIAELSHSNVSLEFTLKSNPQTAEKYSGLTAGINKFCVKQKGVYTIKPIAANCFKFEKDSYEQEIGHPHTQNLVINVDKFQAVGRVTIRTATHQLFNLKDFQMQVTPSEGPAFFAQMDKIGERNGTYELQYSIWSRANQQYTFKPISSSGVNVIFYPEQSVFGMTEKSCVNTLPQFEGRPGLFLEGSISPPVDSAHVVVYSFQGTSRQEAKLLLETTTTKDGKYNVGPLHDDRSYYAELTKSGFIFQRVDDLNFKSVKLGQITVRVIDANGQSVAGVLLSLSGESYRSNNMTSSAPFVFENLNPGEYFLRPLLKEYTFEPSSKGITITEGSEAVVNLSAKRVAFSCFGTVRSLNGDPERSVTVEAVPLSHDTSEREEAQTESNGAFRIRGLIPGRSYSIGVKADGEKIDRSFPQNINIVVDNKDIQGTEFVIFKKANKFDVTGVVKIPEGIPISSITISLWKVNNTEGGHETFAHVRSVELGVHNFFEFQGMLAGAYEVQVSSSLSPSTYVIPGLKQRIQVRSNAHLQLQFKITPRVTSDEELSNAPIFTLFFGAIVLATIFYFNELVQIMENIASGKLKFPPMNSTQPIPSSTIKQDSSSDWLPKGLKPKHKKK